MDKLLKEIYKIRGIITPLIIEGKSEDYIKKIKDLLINIFII